ncbi:MAG: peptidase M61, partial [Flavobacteriales bacterium]|nr:peptidase M61 [Flavobacteriales bacterium]
FLPAFGGDYLGQMVKDVSAHEFFHIVTPLTFHSEEIHYFDYNNPKMSKHLWLYEGVTEYSAHLVQVRQGLISLDDFLTEMNDKINSAKNFNDTLPFTLLSQACLTTYKTQYLNVYQKGALIGMCLDLTLLHLSNGEMDLPKLLNKLSKEYGANKPFKDDELFEIMAKNSYPAVLDFLNNYVGGSKPLPFEQVFSYAGVEFSKGGMVDITDFGFDFEQAGYDEKTDKFYIISDADISPVGKAMGLKAGDIIQKIKDKELKMETVYEILLDLYQNTKPADPLSYEVARPLKNNKTKKIVLKGRVGTKAMSVEGGLSLIENPTDSQRKIMKAWTNQ